MLRIKELREKRGMTQEELAYRSGLSVGTVRRIENQKNAPNSRTLNALAKALGYKSLDALYARPPMDEVPA